MSGLGGGHFTPQEVTSWATEQNLRYWESSCLHCGFTEDDFKKAGRETPDPIPEKRPCSEILDNHCVTKKMVDNNLAKFKALVQEPIQKNFAKKGRRFFKTVFRNSFWVDFMKRIRNDIFWGKNPYIIDTLVEECFWLRYISIVPHFSITFL